MSKAKENHIRIVELLAEAKVCLSDEVSVHRGYRCTFR